MIGLFLCDLRIQIPRRNSSRFRNSVDRFTLDICIRSVFGRISEKSYFSISNYSCVVLSLQFSFLRNRALCCNLQCTIPWRFAVFSLRSLSRYFSNEFFYFYFLGRSFVRNHHFSSFLNFISKAQSTPYLPSFSLYPKGFFHLHL